MPHAAVSRTCRRASGTAEKKRRLPRGLLGAGRQRGAFRENCAVTVLQGQVLSTAQMGFPSGSANPPNQKPCCLSREGSTVMTLSAWRKCANSSWRSSTSNCSRTVFLLRSPSTTLTSVAGVMPILMPEAVSRQAVMEFVVAGVSDPHTEDIPVAADQFLIVTCQDNDLPRSEFLPGRFLDCCGFSLGVRMPGRLSGSRRWRLQTGCRSVSGNSASLFQRKSSAKNVFM